MTSQDLFKVIHYLLTVRIRDRKKFQYILNKTEHF